MVSEDDVVDIVNDWLLCQLASDNPPTVGDLIAALEGEYDPTTNSAFISSKLVVEIDEIRDRVSGWHFAQDAMTPMEREVLSVAEGLLRILDRTVNVQ